MHRLPWIIAVVTGAIVGLLILCLSNQALMNLIDWSISGDAGTLRLITSDRIVLAVGFAIAVGAFIWSVLYLLLGRGGILGISASLNLDLPASSAANVGSGSRSNSAHVQQAFLSSTTFLSLDTDQANSKTKSSRDFTTMVPLQASASMRLATSFTKRDELLAATVDDADVVPAIHMPRMPGRPEPRAAMESLLERLEKVALLPVASEPQQASG